MGTPIIVSEKNYRDIVNQVGKHTIDKHTVNYEILDNSEIKKHKKITSDEQIEQNTDTILQLHNSILESLAQSLTSAIKVGELLFEQKRLIKYGKFSHWARENLTFSLRTAQRYMKLFLYKEALTEKGVSSITDAYHHLFDMPISDEIIEVDDGISPTYVHIPENVNVNDIVLPKKRPKGLMCRATLRSSTIEDLISGKGWENCEGRYSKIVVEIVSGSSWNDRIGPFAVAAAKYIRPGGKIIFHKVR